MAGGQDGIDHREADAAGGAGDQDGAGHGSSFARGLCPLALPHQGATAPWTAGTTRRGGAGHLILHSTLREVGDARHHRRRGDRRAGRGAVAARGRHRGRCLRTDQRDPPARRGHQRAAACDARTDRTRAAGPRLRGGRGHARTRLRQPLRPDDLVRTARAPRRLHLAAGVDPSRPAAPAAAGRGARKAGRCAHPPRRAPGRHRRGPHRHHRPLRGWPHRARRRADRRRRHPFRRAHPLLPG